MKTLKLLSVAFIIFTSNAYSQPNCDQRIKDIKPLIKLYMQKNLGFTTTDGIKISCPGGYKSKSYGWKEIVGTKGPDDIFIVKGVAITPTATKGGYYEIFFHFEYSCWHNREVYALDNNWTKSYSNITTYKPHNVPGENIGDKEKLNIFFEYINKEDNISRFTKIQDYIQIDTIYPLGNINVLSTTKKEIFLKIKGQKIKDCNSNSFFTYLPNASNTVKLIIVKENQKWSATFGVDEGYDFGEKFTILKPLKIKYLGNSGWDAVYKKMQITEGELKYMSENLAKRLNKRVKSFAKMMNKELTGDKTTDIAKIKAYMLPDIADELANKWYNLDVGGVDCGVEVNKYNFSGEVKREDKGGVRAYYNFAYNRPAATTPEQTELYRKCGVQEANLTKYFSKRESGKIQVEFINKEWYISEFPPLKYNYNGEKRDSETKKNPSSNSNSKKKKRMPSILKAF